MQTYVCHTIRRPKRMVRHIKLPLEAFVLSQSKLTKFRDEKFAVWQDAGRIHIKNVFYSDQRRLYWNESQGGQLLRVSCIQSMRNVQTNVFLLCLCYTKSAAMNIYHTQQKIEKYVYCFHDKWHGLDNSWTLFSKSHTRMRGWCVIEAHIMGQSPENWVYCRVVSIRLLRSKWPWCIRDVNAYICKWTGVIVYSLLVFIWHSAWTKHMLWGAVVLLGHIARKSTWASSIHFSGNQLHVQ